MRIAYCTNVRLPNERAHGLQIASVVRSLAALGHTVDIVHPFRHSEIASDIWSYHNLPRASVHIHTLGSFDPIKCWWTPGVVGLYVLNFLFCRCMKKELMRRQKDFDLLYTRSPALLPILLSIGVPVIIELHTIPSFFRRRFLSLLKQCRLIVALTEPMRGELLTLGMDPAKVIVAHDGVDLDRFSNIKDEQNIYTKYNLPSGVPLIGYVGQLQSMGLSKGIPELLAAAKELLGIIPNFTLVIAGGPDAIAQSFSRSLDTELLSHIRFLGPIPADDVPALLKACDVLVYPAPASNHPFYLRDTSPLKIFEYMAAEKPIVAANLPTLKGVLDTRNALLVPPGDATALAHAIVEVLSSPADAKVRAHQAYFHVQQYSWEVRMQRILGAAKISK